MKSCLLSIALVVFVSPAFGTAEETENGVRLPAEPSQEILIEGSAAGLLLEDVDGDGSLDLLVAANRGGREGPSYLFLSREGKFRKPSWVSADKSVSAAVAVGDLDGDGVLDLVLARYNHHPAASFRGKGKGRFEATPFWESDDTQSANGVRAADFDGDGSADILAAGGTAALRIYRGGEGGPSKEFGWQYQDQRFAVSKTAWIDIDCDGRKDLVLTHWSGPALLVLRGLKADFETRPFHVSREIGEFHGLAAGDLDGDGFPEIAVGATAHRMGDGRVRLYGNRKGRPAQEPLWMSDDVDALTQELVFHDLDRDGDPDLLVLSGDHTAAYENRKGILVAAPFWRATIEGGCALVADLDKNGWPDLLTGGRGKIWIRYGGPEVPLRKTERFPPSPAFPALAGGEIELMSEPPEESEEDEEAPAPGKIPVLDYLGLKLAPITPALAARYGLEDSNGSVVLSVPPDVNVRFEIGNLREGDVLLGAGSLRDYGRTVDRAADPWAFRKLVLDYGQEGGSHLVGVQWRCGPLHPGRKGQVRQERLRLKPEDWSRLSGEREPARPAQVTLEGTVSVIDPDGDEHTEENGSFDLLLWSGNSGQHREVQVIKGRFKTDIPAGVKLSIDELRLSGRQAYLELEEEKHFTIPADRTLELQAKWPAETLLRVVGEDAGMDLKDLQLVSDLDWEQRDALHPGNYPDKAVVVSGGKSPLELSETRSSDFQAWNRVYWVHSPGYAWARVEVDFRVGGEKRVVLKRAAAAEITVVNFNPESRGVLRLSSLKVDPDDGDVAGGRPILELSPRPDGPTRIEGLIPGRYLASVEIGQWYKDPEVLGRTVVEALPGEITAASLELKDPLHRGDPVPLEGTLYIPIAWGRNRPSILLEPLDLPDTGQLEDGDRFDRVKFEAVPDEPGLYRWSAGRVVPGKYVAKLYEFEYQQVIAVGPLGEKNAKIEIGEPADVSVEVLDAETGQPAEVDVWWCCKFPEGVSGGSLDDAKWNPSSGRFEFRAPVGEIDLHAGDFRYEDGIHPLRIHPGKNEHTLRLTRASGVRIRFLDGDLPVSSIPDEYEVTLKPAEGELTERSWGSRGKYLYVAVPAPGLYDLTVKPIEGFDPVPPQRVQVKPKEFLEVTINLVRAK